MFAPVEPPECIIRLIPDEVPLDDLVIQGLRYRPELASARELVEAAIMREAGEAAPLRSERGVRPPPAAGSAAERMRSSATSGPGATSRPACSGTCKTSASATSPSCTAGRPNARRRTSRRSEQARVAADVVAAYESRQVAVRQIEESRETVTEALDSLKLNFTNIRQGAELPRATRPIEVLQPIQALAQARLDYLDSVLDYNRSQFRLKRAIGQQP